MTRRGFPKPLIYDLGDQTTAKFSTDKGGNVTLSYYADKGEFDRLDYFLTSSFSSGHIIYSVVGSNELNFANITLFACEAR